MKTKFLMTLFCCVCYGLYCQQDTVIIYNSDSTIISKGKFSNSKKIGIWLDLSYPSGHVLKKVQYFTGDSARTWEYDFYSGNLKENYTIYRVDSNTSVIRGKYVAYHKNGLINRTGYFNSNGKGTGVWTTYYESGIRQQVAKYSNGKLSGEYVEFYENGNIHKAGQYINDNRVGKWKEYYPKGTVKSLGVYCPSVHRIGYSPSTVDSLTRAGRDINDLVFPILQFCKDGPWKYFDDQGKLIRIEKWANGRLK